MINMRKNISLFPLFTILIVWITSCNNFTSATPINTNYWWTLWLERPVCISPCWQNITPGTTSIKEATIILEKIPSVIITYEGKYGVSWVFEENKTDSGNISISPDGIVSSIRLGNSSDKDLYLETVISSYGEPAYLVLYDCRALENSGEAMCATALVYPDTGLLIVIFLEDVGDMNNYKINIQSDTIINSVILFQPGMKNFQNFPEFQEHNLLEWNGYSTYSSDVQQ